jgi:hypothetical protein
MEQIHHGPEMAPLFHVHLKQISQVVQAGASLTEPSLLLDARGLGIPLGNNQAAKLIAELARYFLPDRLSREVAESYASIVDRIGEKNPPAVFGKFYVLEVGPSGGIDAHRGTNVDLVVILESLRAHVFPPLDVFGLPVFESPLQTFIAGESDVIWNLLG